MDEYRISVSLTDGLHRYLPEIPVTRESSGCTASPIRLAIDRNILAVMARAPLRAHVLPRRGLDRARGRERRVSAPAVRALVSALGACAALTLTGVPRARAECDRAAADVSWVRLAGAEAVPLGTSQFRAEISRRLGQELVTTGKAASIEAVVQGQPGAWSATVRTEQCDGAPPTVRELSDHGQSCDGIVAAARGASCSRSIQTPASPPTARPPRAPAGRRSRRALQGAEPALPSSGRAEAAETAFPWPAETRTRLRRGPARSPAGLSVTGAGSLPWASSLALGSASPCRANGRSCRGGRSDGGAVAPGAARDPADVRLRPHGGLARRVLGDGPEPLGLLGLCGPGGLVGAIYAVIDGTTVSSRIDPADRRRLSRACQPRPARGSASASSGRCRLETGIDLFVRSDAV